MKNILLTIMLFSCANVAWAQHHHNEHHAKVNHIGAAVTKSLNDEGWMYHVHYLRKLRATHDKVSVGLGGMYMSAHGQYGVSLPVAVKPLPNLMIMASPAIVNHHDEWELAADINATYAILPLGPVHLGPTVGYMVGGGHGNQFFAGLHAGLPF